MVSGGVLHISFTGREPGISIAVIQFSLRGLARQRAKSVLLPLTLNTYLLPCDKTLDWLLHDVLYALYTIYSTYTLHCNIFSVCGSIPYRMLHMVSLSFSACLSSFSATRLDNRLLCAIICNCLFPTVSFVKKPTAYSTPYAHPAILPESAVFLLVFWRQ
jgi:hypothetical protein